jgi:hypothetical protein
MCCCFSLHKITLIIKGRLAVAEWLWSLTSCGFESGQGLWILSYEGGKAIQLAYGTPVVLFRCPYVSEICIEERLRSSTTSIAWKSPYDFYRVGVKSIKREEKRDGGIHTTNCTVRYVRSLRTPAFLLRYIPKIYYSHPWVKYLNCRNLLKSMNF